MGWARDPSCRAERVLEPVVSQLRIPTGVEMDGLTHAGPLSRPLLNRASDGLDGGGRTPAGQTDGRGQAERQRTAMPRRQGDGQVRYVV